MKTFFRVLILAIACLSGPDAVSAGTERPDILLITIDTLRADRLGAYGHKEGVSPRIDAFAADAAVFSKAFTPFPLTGPAHLSLFTSLYPVHHRMMNNWTVRQTGHTTLAEILSGNGYETAAFTSATVTEKRSFGQGFDVYEEVPPVASHPADVMEGEENLDWLAYREKLERSAGNTTDAALAWLEKREPARPLFLWVHYYDPHFPYLPPGPEGADREKWKDLNLGLKASDYRGAPEQRELLSLLYDSEVRYTDAQTGRLFDFLRSKGSYDGSVIILTSDHGEVLGERDGFYGHHNHIHNETLHIPLMMKFPGIAPRKTDVLCSLMDVMPTLLSYLQIKDSERGRRDGMDLLPMLERGRRVPDRAFYVSTVHLSGEYPPRSGLAGFDAHQGRVTLQGILTRRWKYWKSDDFEGDREFLFDLDADPGEKRNLASGSRLEAGRLKRLLAPYERKLEQLRKSLGLPPVSGDDKEFGESEQERLETLRKLRSLGYA